MFHCLGRHLKAKSTEVTISAKRRHPRINWYQKVWSHLACSSGISIKDQLLVGDTTQVYKIVNGLAPLYLSSKLSKRSDTHHYNTRKRDNLNLPLCRRTVTAQRSFYYRAVSALNSQTADTRNNPSLCTFKRSVKSELRVQTPCVKWLIFDLV